MRRAPELFDDLAKLRCDLPALPRLERNGLGEPLGARPGRGLDQDARSLQPGLETPRAAERVEQRVGQADPARLRDDQRARPAGNALLDDPAVADVDEPVGDRGRRLVVADDDGRRALLAGELGDQAVDGVGVVRVQLAGGLVGEQQVGPVRERGAERDPLLLAAGEARGPVVEPVAEADSLEQPRRHGARFRTAGTEELEPEAHGLRASEVG